MQQYFSLSNKSNCNLFV